MVHANETSSLGNVTGLGEKRHTTDEFERLRQSYHTVFFDFPGLARSPDARAMARFLDAVIVVAAAGVTPLDSVRSAVQALYNARAPVVGIVLNKVRTS
jgi:Mrp family chromosome partitioning ATPase